MPLTKKGKKVMDAMIKKYGKKKGTKVFYASSNKGRIKGVERGKHQEENVVANAMKTRKGMAIKPIAVKSNKKKNKKKSSKSKSPKLKYQEDKWIFGQTVLELKRAL